MTPRELDEIIETKWPAVIRTVKLEGGERWLIGFALSIRKHSKREGWMPSPKQVRIMRQLLREYGSSEVVDLRKGDPAH